MRNDFDSNTKLPWQIELGLGSAATFLSGLVLLVGCGMFEHVINQVLEAVATAAHQEAVPEHLSIGTLWPVLLTLYVVMSAASYWTLRQGYTNLLNKFTGNP